METAESKGKSRKSRRKDREKRNRKPSHFSTVRFGGCEEGQIICYLWEIVKALEAVRTADARGANGLRELEKRMRGRVRVEMRRYFVRRRAKGIRILAGIVAAALGIGSVFFFLIGIDHVAGMSMYPYLNDKDWIVYSRIVNEIRRDDVVVFEKNGEVMIKRVVGLPGEHVEMNRAGNQVVVNGEQMKEEYVTMTAPDAGETKELPAATQVIMNGQYLVLGDNRVDSVDSRDSNIGTVASEDVLGKVRWIIRDGR